MSDPQTAVPRLLQIGLLYNPSSGYNRRHPGVLAQEASTCEHVTLRAVQSPGEVQAALAELARLPVDLLIICGGDGTVQAVLSALFHSRPFAVIPPLAVLAAGTTNMIAADAGLAGRPLKYLRLLLAQENLEGMRCVSRPVLRLQIPGQDDRYGMFLGMAAISQGTTYYQEHFHNQGWQGLPGIVLTLVRSLATTMGRGARKPMSTRLGIASENISGQKRSEQAQEIILALITTHQRLLFGLEPFWGKEEDGPLRCTLVDAQARGLVWRLPFLAWGKSWAAAGGQGYASWNCHTLQLKLDGPLTLDGELYRSAHADDPILVSCGGTVKLVREL